MKSLKKLIVVISLIFVVSALSAQTLPPPNGGVTPVGTNTPVGGGAPIGGGLFILLGLGAAYGGTKGYKFYQKKKSSLLE